MKTLLLLDYDGDKIYLLDNNAPENQVIINNYEPDMPLIVSPLENLKAPKYKITKEEMLKVDERTLQNYTGVYTNMGTYYQNFKYHVNYRFNGLLTMLATADARFWNEFSILMPAKTYQGLNLSVMSYEAVHDLITTELKRLNDESDYNIVMIRIGSAGEIDFTKHGTRFALPMSVETNKVPLWLKDYITPDEKFITKTVLEYGVIEWVWVEDGVKKRLYKMDTPMQYLADDVTSYYKKAVSNVQENSMGDITSAFLGSGFIIPGSVRAIYDKVIAIAQEFSNEVAQVRLRTRGYSSEERSREYQLVYSKYIDLCGQFTDRKALAISGLYYDKTTGSKSNFPFICCYDGLIELLLEQPTVSPRIARINVPSWVDTVYVETQGRNGYIADGSYKELDIEIPFITSYCNLQVKDGVVESMDTTTAEIIATPVALEDGVYYYTGKSFVIYNKIDIKLPTILAPGAYSIKSYFGKTYIAFNYYLPEESRKELSDARYNNRFAQGMTSRDANDNVVARKHMIETVIGKRDKFQIVGMSKVEQPTNAVEVAELIKEYNGQCVVVKGLKNDGTFAPMVSIGGRIVGMIATKDNVKIKREYTIDYHQMYGHVFRLAIDGATHKINGEPLVSLEVLAKVESLVPFTNPINKVHSICDLSKWYWNVDWVTFGNLGYGFKGVSFFAKPEMDQEFATLTLDVNGQDMFVVVKRAPGETGLKVSRVIFDNQLIDISQFDKAFEGVVYRAVGYMYAQSLMK